MIQNPFPSKDLPAIFDTAGPTDPGPSNPDADFEQSRKNLIQIMEVTKGAIQALSIIAFQSQMPDAYDVLNKLIKEYSGQQSQLIQMYRMKAHNSSNSSGTVSGEVVDNRTQNVFVGTPADLAKILEQTKKPTE